jgi:hypothetical protein
MSAISNAKQASVKEDSLFVESVTVNKGIVLKRSMPRARGSASRINKRTSHVALFLIEKTAEKKAKPAKKAEKEVIIAKKSKSVTKKQEVKA